MRSKQIDLVVHNFPAQPSPKEPPPPDLHSGQLIESLVSTVEKAEKETGGER